MTSHRDQVPPDRPTVLVLRALGLGDLLTGIPALRALRSGYAGHRIVLAAPAALEPVARASGAVDQLLPTGELEPVPWSGPGPQVAVNLHGRGPHSHRLLLATRPHRLLAFAHPGLGWMAGPTWYPGEHEVRRWCRLVEWYGMPADPMALDLPRPPAPALSGAVLIHPGAKDPARRWPAERFAAVAAALAARGERIVITGSRQEAPLGQWIARRAGLPPRAVLAGRTALGQLAALVAHARLVVCGDTGVGHLATAYRTPSVLVFGPVPPTEWGPLPTRSWHRVLWHPQRPPRDTVAAVTVTEVISVAEELLMGAGCTGNNVSDKDKSELTRYGGK